MEEEASTAISTMDISKYPSIYIIATTFLIIILIFLLHMKTFKELCATCHQTRSRSEPGDISMPLTVSISEPTLLTAEEVRTNIPRFSEFFRDETNNSSDEELEDDVFETIALDTLSFRTQDENTYCTFSGNIRGKKTDSITESTDDIIFDNSMATGSSEIH